MKISIADAFSLTNSEQLVIWRCCVDSRLSELLEVEVEPRHHRAKPKAKKEWRRGWDLNPRLSFPNTRFPSVLLKPLGHLSARTALQKPNKLNPGRQTACPSTV